MKIASPKGEYKMKRERYSHWITSKQPTFAEMCITCVKENGKQVECKINT